MLITPENREEILQRMQTDFIANIPESNPFIRESWLLALLIAISGREFDIYTQLSQLLLDLFPNTASGIFADQWGNLKGVKRLAATSARGFISVPGTATTLIPIGTLWNSVDPIQYESKYEDSEITDASIDIIELTSSGGIALATTNIDHNLATGMTVETDGADNSEYNITAQITVPASNQYKYKITGTPPSPDLGVSKVVKATFAIVEVQALQTGITTNLSSGSQITLTTPIAGADSTSYVQYDELAGGSDDETGEEYRLRYLDKYQQQTANFNEATIIAKMKEVGGVTRPSVQKITPDVGDVTVYFLRDNDPDPIPSPSEIEDVKDVLLTITPAHTPTDGSGGLFVRAPTPINIKFVFSIFEPSTSTMRAAVEASLEEYFKNVTTVGVDVSECEYTTVISSTIDPNTGTEMGQFNLTSPTGNIDVNSNEIALFSTISYP